MSYSIFIPARMGSSRLPGKVLQDIAGKPMLQHVYELACSTQAELVCIATDSLEVEAVARGFGATVCMTSDTHATGTERVAEAVDALQLESDEIVICLQADEPQMPVSVIEAIAEDLQSNETVKVSTPCTPIHSVEELMDPSVVKVVMNKRGNATYFSRAPIPWNRDQFAKQDKNATLQGEYFRHIGVYGYRADMLQRLAEWDPSPAESLESLEQLRVLWNGGKIHMVVVKQGVELGVDTPEDLQRARAALAE